MMGVQDKIRLTRQVMIIAGIFCAFTGLLLLLNFWHIKQNKPLESLALQALVDRLASDPNNEELKQEIRNLDLLARKAYFTSQWQVQTGNYMLFFGAVIFAAALWYNQKLIAKIDKPLIPDRSELIDRLHTRKWLLIAGGVFIVLSFVSSFFSNDYLKLYNQTGIPESQSEDKGSGQPEIITISKIDTRNNSVSSDTLNNSVSPEKAKDSAAVAKSPEQIATSSAVLSYETLKKQHNMFRGVFGQGISYRTNIPVDWDGAGGKNVIWKVAVDKPGFNSPLIWDDKLFLAGGDESARVVYCYNKNNGKLLWKKEASGIKGSPAVPPHVSDDTGLSAPTMTVDGRGVYAIFATGDLIAFDMEGKLLWARNLGVPDNHYGHSSSLLVWDDKLFIQFDTNKGGRMLALNCTNGQTVWDIKRPNKISWASPVLIRLGEVYQIITTADPNVAAYDPFTGKQLWSVECMMGEVGPSVAYANGLIFAANEYAKLVALEPGMDNVKILWENDEYLPEASSPVAYQGFLYLATSYGVVVCYDAQTGEKYWEHEAGQGFYSSPVIADGKLYVIDMNGKMHIFKTGKEKTILSEPELGEKAFATPAFTDNRIYLRGQKNLYCIGTK